MSQIADGAAGALHHLLTRARHFAPCDNGPARTPMPNRRPMPTASGACWPWSPQPGRRPGFPVGAGAVALAGQFHRPATPYPGKGMAGHTARRGQSGRTAIAGPASVCAYGPSHRTSVSDPSGPAIKLPATRTSVVASPHAIRPVTVRPRPCPCLHARLSAAGERSCSREHFHRHLCRRCPYRSAAKDRRARLQTGRLVPRLPVFVPHVQSWRCSPDRHAELRPAVQSAVPAERNWP